MKNVELISKLDLFRGLTHDDMNNIASIAVEKKFNRNQVVFSAGDEGNGFYTIIDGMVRIFLLSPNGKEQILHIFREGDVFGEVPVFVGGEFPAYATTLEDTRLLFFPKDSFMNLIQKDPTLAMKIIGELSGKIKFLVEMVDNLSLKEVPARLAKYLMLLSEQNDESDLIELDITKGHLSSLLGTIPETLSRIITKMENEGIIESIAKRSVRILDRDKLDLLESGELKLS
jgi:CRP-like cAMP-binding protein